MKKSNARYAALIVAPLVVAGVAVYLLRSSDGATREPAHEAAPKQRPAPPRRSQRAPAQPQAPAQELAGACAVADLGGIRPLRLSIVTRKEKAGAAAHPVADQRPKLARLTEEVYLYAVLRARHNGKVVHFTAADRVRLGRRRLPASKVKAWPLSCKPRIRWFKVEPTHNNYSYVKRSNPIAYAETALGQGWRVLADVHPSHLDDQFKKVKSGVGVMRFKATMALGDHQLSTPGKGALHRGGVSKKLVRVTHRPHTGKISDYAFELFNTPYIWGSMGFQVEGQIGVDCADLMVYSLRRSGRKLGYTWSKGLVADRRRFARVKDGKVKVGDILYHGRHVGMLHEENGNGVLDNNDKVVHTLFHEPEVLTVKKFGWPEVVLRWRRR